VLKREALPLFGRRIARALTGNRSPAEGEALVTLWEACHRVEGGEELSTTWPAFFEALRERRPWRGSWWHPGFSLATFAPNVRTRANVRSVTALVMTFRGVSVDVLRARWGNCFGLVQTTHLHAPGRPSVRAVLPFARPASAAEHAAFAAWACRRSDEAGHRCEPDAANIAQFVYLPGAVPGSPFETAELCGAMLDPDAPPPAAGHS
jgi:hypothetical protein